MVAKRKTKKKAAKKGGNNLLVYLVLGILAVVGYKYLTGSDFKTSSEADVEPNPTIEIQDSTHTPETLTVEAGEVVLVLNKDEAEHSVTSEDGLFDTRLLDQNELGMFTAPLEPGEYEYTCTNHPEMTGVLVVE